MHVTIDLGTLLGIMAALVSIAGGGVAVLAYFAEKRKHIQLEGGRVRIMEELQGKVTALEGENTDLKQRIACHDTDLSTLEVKLANVDSKLSDLKLSMDRMNDKLDRLVENHKP